MIYDAAYTNPNVDTKRQLFLVPLWLNIFHLKIQKKLVHFTEFIQSFNIIHFLICNLNFNLKCILLTN